MCASQISIAAETLTQIVLAEPHMNSLFKNQETSQAHSASHTQSNRSNATLALGYNRRKPRNLDNPPVCEENSKGESD
jgi:hypothetical protein